MLQADNKVGLDFFPCESPWIFFIPLGLLLLTTALLRMNGVVMSAGPLLLALITTPFIPDEAPRR